MLARKKEHFPPRACYRYIKYTQFFQKTFFIGTDDHELTIRPVGAAAACAQATVIVGKRILFHVGVSDSLAISIRAEVSMGKYYCDVKFIHDRQSLEMGQNVPEPVIASETLWSMVPYFPVGDQNWNFWSNLSFLAEPN